MFNLVIDCSSRQIETHLKLFKIDMDFLSPFLFFAIPSGEKVRRGGIQNTEVIIKDVNI